MCYVLLTQSFRSKIKLSDINAAKFSQIHPNNVHLFTMLRSSVIHWSRKSDVWKRMLQKWHVMCRGLQFGPVDSTKTRNYSGKITWHLFLITCSSDVCLHACACSIFLYVTPYGSQIYSDRDKHWHGHTDNVQNAGYRQSVRGRCTMFWWDSTLRTHPPQQTQTQICMCSGVHWHYINIYLFPTSLGQW